MQSATTTNISSCPLVDITKDGEILTFLGNCNRGCDCTCDKFLILLLTIIDTIKRGIREEIEELASSFEEKPIVKRAILGVKYLRDSNTFDLLHNLTRNYKNISEACLASIIVAFLRYENGRVPSTLDV